MSVKSARKLLQGDQINRLNLRLDHAEVERIECREASEVCTLTLAQVQLVNVFTTSSDGVVKEHVGRVIIEGGDDARLEIQAGANQRISCIGMNDDQQAAVRQAPTDQLGRLVSERTDRAEVAAELMSSLNKEELDELLRKLNPNS